MLETKTIFGIKNKVKKCILNDFLTTAVNVRFGIVKGNSRLPRRYMYNHFSLKGKQ